MEWNCSTAQKSPVRTALTGKTVQVKRNNFHRSVVCMTVGKVPHVILGQEMLKPKDGAEKDEGELTGGKRGSAFDLHYLSITGGKRGRLPVEKRI